FAPLKQTDGLRSELRSSGLLDGFLQLVSLKRTSLTIIRFSTQESSISQKNLKKKEEAKIMTIEDSIELKREPNRSNRQLFGYYFSFKSVFPSLFAGLPDRLVEAFVFTVN
ncbi:TPA: hypothetical protein HA338_10400, partial [Methanosarcina acetivorans]